MTNWERWDGVRSFAELFVDMGRAAVTAILEKVDVIDTRYADAINRDYPRYDVMNVEAPVATEEELYG